MNLKAFDIYAAFLSKSLRITYISLVPGFYSLEFTPRSTGEVGRTYLTLLSSAWLQVSVGCLLIRGMNSFLDLARFLPILRNCLIFLHEGCILGLSTHVLGCKMLAMGTVLGHGKTCRLP